MISGMETNFSDLLTLVFGLAGVAGTIFGTFVWVGQQKATVIQQGREIADLKSAVAAYQAEIHQKLDAHRDNLLLVARLDERLAGLERTLRDQPQTIALCVGEAFKAAMRINMARQTA